MSDIGAKVAYVKRQGQTRLHECHWPGCSKQVPPAMWGCREHWYALPRDLRNQVWRCYRPGQEADGKPSVAYIMVARDVQAWILVNHPPCKNTANAPVRADGGCLKCNADAGEVCRA